MGNDDLIKSLRKDTVPLVVQEHCHLAADEIERLTAENEKLEADNYRMENILVSAKEAIKITRKQTDQAIAENTKLNARLDELANQDMKTMRIETLETALAKTKTSLEITTQHNTELEIANKAQAERIEELEKGIEAKEKAQDEREDLRSPLDIANDIRNLAHRLANRILDMGGNSA